MAITILLVNDHKIMREGLRMLIEKYPDMQVIAEAEDGRTAVELARKFLPDIVILDVTLPGLNGIEATRRIVKEIPGIRVAVLSIHSDKRFAIEMLNAGASGYLLKSSAFKELVQAIHALMKGQTYLSSQLTGIAAQGKRNSPGKKSSVFSALTGREREVLQLVAEGKSTKDIASLLNISIKTVETHRRQIMKKLNIFSIAELTKYAIREGLTTLAG